MQQPVAATPLLGQLPLAKYSTEIYSLGCPILVKSLNFVPLIRVSIRIDILGRFLHFQRFDMPLQPHILPQIPER